MYGRGRMWIIHTASSYGAQSLALLEASTTLHWHPSCPVTGSLPTQSVVAVAPGLQREHSLHGSSASPGGILYTFDMPDRL